VALVISPSKNNIMWHCIGVSPQHQCYSTNIASLSYHKPVLCFLLSKCLHILVNRCCLLPQVLQQLDAVPPALVTAAAAAAAGDILLLRLLVLDVLLAPSDGSSRTCNAEKDPVVAITCQITHTGSSSSSEANQAGHSAAHGDSGTGAEPQQHKVAFVLAGAAANGVLPVRLSAEGFQLLLFASEGQLLMAWRDWVLQADPDGIAVFQVGLR
jgi:hypothetical protein